LFKKYNFYLFLLFISSTDESEIRRYRDASKTCETNKHKKIITK